jgi:hypothetical protein
MLERMKHSEGLGAIYPPMQYSIMALDVLGLSRRIIPPVRVEAVRQFDNLMVDDGKTLLLPALLLAVWDTAIAGLRARRSRLRPIHPRSTKAADWLLAREIRRNGDWSVKRPNTEPSGWAFEFQNDWYPDIDDTAMVMLAFPHMRASNPRRRKHPAARLDWLLAMQSKDGGWAAFDVDNNWEILTHVPFADHNAMLDPTCADITGPHARSAGGQRIRPQLSGLPPRHRLSDPHAAFRWQLVWPLGRGVIFTAPVSRCAACAPWAKTITSRTFSAPTNGCVPSRIPMADGAKAAPVTTTICTRRRKHAFADRVGADGPDGRRRYLQLQRAAGLRISDLNPARRRHLARGTGHRHGLPQGLLPQLPLYKDYFPLLALTSFVKSRARSQA